MATSIIASMLLGRGRPSIARRLAPAAGAAAGRSHTPAAAAALSTAAAPFHYQELFDLGKDTETRYKKLTSDYVSTFKVRLSVASRSIDRLDPPIPSACVHSCMGRARPPWHSELT